MGYEVHSLMDFKSGFDYLMHANANANASKTLSFEQNDYSMMEWTLSLNQNNRKYFDSEADPRLLEDFDTATASNYGFMVSDIARERHDEDWLYTDSILESGSQDAGSCLKRLTTGQSMQAVKKQCSAAASTISAKKPMPKTSVASKDPLSIAAKNRRERINERLKLLQELVPNGSKVDLVTMLEKAIGYVKFLQLQVKVLATDEFWPVEGGKAPNISQVREAIDGILSSSQRDRPNSSSM